MLTDFPLVFATSNLPNCCVLHENGQILCHAGLWPRELIVGDRRLKVGVLTAVATHPNCRHRGYAAQAVSALQELMHQEAYDLGLLWTGVPELYRKLGWETVVPRGARIALTGAGRPASEHLPYQVRSFHAAEHLDAVIALHEREAVRFFRRPNEFQMLLALPKIETSVAVASREIVAYLIHATGCNKRGLIEYGGRLDGMEALVADAVHRMPMGSEVPLLAYHVRPDLIAWAQRLNLPMTPLESSKGMGVEMIYRVRPQKISSDDCDQLFAWGLDQA